MTGGHPDDAKSKISVVNDIKLRLAERISLLNYADIVRLVKCHFDFCLCGTQEKVLCAICQIAVDFELE